MRLKSILESGWKVMEFVSQIKWSSFSIELLCIVPSGLFYCLLLSKREKVPFENIFEEA